MSNYIDVIKTAVIFFPFIAFIFSIPFILINYHKYGSISFVKSLIVYSFILYLICAYFLVILPLPSKEYVSSLISPRVQLIPFKFVYDFIKLCDFSSIKSIILDSTFYVPLYNIFLTLPFAIYIRYYFNTGLKKTILFTFLLSLFFELTQLSGLYFIYPRGYRLFDVDDLFLNTLGGLFGYLLSIWLLKFLPSTEKINIEAKEKGMVLVSGFRKGTCIILDIILCLFMYFILFLFKLNIKNMIYYVFIFYYFVLPLFFKGRTLGELFLKILVVNNKDDKVNVFRTYFRRILFIIMYVVITYVICYILFLYLYIFSTKIKVFICIIVGSILFLYYVISGIKYFFFKKRILYEVLSGTKYISTIK